MKRTVLLHLFTAALITVTAISIYAQPTLQSTNLQTGIGFDIYSLNNVTAPELTPAGANQTWDLRTATLGTLAGHLDFVDPATTPYASTYPTSNFAMKFTVSGAVSYNFDHYTSSVWEEMVLNAGTGGLQTFSNNRTIVPFPFTFNQSDTDIYQKNGQSSHFIVHHYDAYGTLRLSTGDITNLIRDNNSDDGAGTGGILLWQTSPIAPVLQADNTGVKLYIASNPSGINESAKGLSFHLYPNPATTELRIMSERPIDQIEIVDMSGRTLITTAQSVIDIADLASGIYLVRASIHGTVETSRFVRQ